MAIPPFMTLFMQLVLWSSPYVVRQAKGDFGLWEGAVNLGNLG